MLAFPPCKINLGLNILRKRADGYHDLDTCFFPVPWTDILEIVPADTLTFNATGHPISGDPDTNLCLRAYQVLQKEFNLPPVSIHLHKIIPMGAGLGGGSSDGAHTLRLLNALFDLRLSEEKLMQYAAQLGSDCAFFIQDKPMRGTGRGEVLSPITIALDNKFLLLAKPDIHVSTAEAYSGVTPHVPTHSISEIIKQPVDQWKNLLVNDFEKSVFVSHPRLSEIKDLLYRNGALYAAMSGSGSTLFGIFDKPVELTISDCIVWGKVI